VDKISVFDISVYDIYSVSERNCKTEHLFLININSIYLCVRLLIGVRLMARIVVHVPVRQS